MSPWRETNPYVGFSPTTPQNAAGCRTDPPVSDPSAAKQAPDATAAALPPELPPGTKKVSPLSSSPPPLGLCSAEIVAFGVGVSGSGKGNGESGWLSVSFGCSLAVSPQTALFRSRVYFFPLFLLLRRRRLRLHGGRLE